MAEPLAAPSMSSFEGIPVEYEKLGVFRTPPLASMSLDSVEPLRPASSVSSLSRSVIHTIIASGAGSIGGFIQSPGGIWLLTANHVIAGNGRLTHFEQPGDGILAGNPPALVSRQVRFIDIDGSPAAVNPADAAICVLDPGLQPVHPLFPASWNMVDGTPARPQKGDTVRFLTRTGQEQAGTVEAPSGVFPVRLNLSGGVDEAVFGGQILIRASQGSFLRPGDSGSLVVLDTPTGTRPLGIAFAFPDNPSQSSMGLVSPLGVILEQLRPHTGGATSILV